MAGYLRKEKAMWWWIEPMLETGVLFILIDAVFFVFADDLITNRGYVWPCVILLVLSIPLFIGIIGFIVCGLLIALKEIWGPFV